MEIAERRELAGRLDQQIRAQVKGIRVHWFGLAKMLYEFDQIDGWQALGLDSLRQWLADPEIKLSLSQGYGMVQAYKTLVVEKKLPPESVQAAEISNLREVLPAVRRGQVEPERAVADATVLTWSDLRETYGSLPIESAPHEKPIKPDDFHYETCKCCGAVTRVKDAA